MQNHYQKKFAIKLAKYIFTSFFNKLVSFIFNEIVLFSKQFFISSFTSLFISSKIFVEFILFTFIEFILFATFFTTLKKQIFWTKIISKSISSKFSSLLFSIFEFLRNTSISFFTFLSIALSMRFYITINNLFVIFNERIKLLNLSHRQKSKFFSYNKQFSKFIFYQTRITSYFLSSFNSFKFNILSKSKLYLFIQTNVFRRHIFFLRAKY